MEYMLRKPNGEYDKWGFQASFKNGVLLLQECLHNQLIDSENTQGQSGIDTGCSFERDVATRAAMKKQTTRVLHGIAWNKNIIPKK